MEQIGWLMILRFSAFDNFFESFETVAPSLLLIGIAQANFGKVSITFKICMYPLFSFQYFFMSIRSPA